jgi:hypothetical protein
VFSEGIAGGVIRRAASSGGGGYGSSREGANEILRKPALIKRDLIKLDPDVEMQQIRDILGDDEDGSLDGKSTDSDNMPIRLIDRKHIRFGFVISAKPMFFSFFSYKT